MPTNFMTGTILFKDGTLLPQGLFVASETCGPNWRRVSTLRGYDLGRAIAGAGWTFFCLAIAIKSTVFGFDKPKRIATAVKRILEKLDHQEFNSVEITDVTAKHFLGVPYATVHARSRHIQESAYIFHAPDFHSLIAPVPAVRPN
jgi:hypothetical protein